MIIKEVGGSKREDRELQIKRASHTEKKDEKKKNTMRIEK